jgi:hypothetical protein
MGEATKVYLHIGTRKSGTTSLQHALAASSDALREVGVHLLLPVREVAKQRLMDPLRVLRSADSDDAHGVARDAVRALRAEIEENGATTHLLSVETLAEMPRRVTDVVIGELADFEVHVVVTGRHWGVTIPSEWQQGVKSRLTITLPDFVTAIEERGEAATGFLARQDVPDIVDRWGALLPPDRVHVVAVPPRTAAAGVTLLDLFCGVVGFDPSLLTLPSGDLNTSLSLGQAELVRRINEALGDRLPLSGGYQEAVRKWVVRGGLMKQERSSIKLPTECAAWAAAEARAQLDALLASGIDLIGRPEDLLPAPDAPTGPLEVGDDEVARIAVETIADLADRHAAQVDGLESRLGELKSQVRQLRSAARRT